MHINYATPKKTSGEPGIDGAMGAWDSNFIPADIKGVSYKNYDSSCIVRISLTPPPRAPMM